jgi:hypothetical protein
LKGLPGYLEWRESIFRSAAGDTSLMEIMPRWMPKSVHRLLQLAIQVGQFIKFVLVLLYIQLLFGFSLAEECRYEKVG